MEDAPSSNQKKGRNCLLARCLKRPEAGEERKHQERRGEKFENKKGLRRRGVVLGGDSIVAPDEKPISRGGSSSVKTIERGAQEESPARALRGGKARGADERRREHHHGLADYRKRKCKRDETRRDQTNPGESRTRRKQVD